MNTGDLGSNEIDARTRVSRVSRVSYSSDSLNMGLEVRVRPATSPSHVLYNQNNRGVEVEGKKRLLTRKRNLNMMLKNPVFDESRVTLDTLESYLEENRQLQVYIPAIRTIQYWWRMAKERVWFMKYYRLRKKSVTALVQPCYDVWSKNARANHFYLDKLKIKSFKALKSLIHGVPSTISKMQRNLSLKLKTKQARKMFEEGGKQNMLEKLVNANRLVMLESKCQSILQTWCYLAKVRKQSLAGLENLMRMAGRGMMNNYCRLLLQMWYRYTFFKKAERIFNNPPDFHPPVDLWNVWVENYERKNLLHKIVGNLYRDSMLQSSFGRWKHIVLSRRRKSMNEARANANCFFLFCSKHFAAWVDISKEGRAEKHWKRIMLRRWRVLATGRRNMKKAGLLLMKRRDRFRLKIAFRIWGNYQRYRQFLTVSALVGIRTCPTAAFSLIYAMKHDKPQFRFIHCWKRWKELSQRRLCFTRFLCIHDKQVRHCILKSFFNAFKRNVIRKRQERNDEDGNDKIENGTGNSIYSSSFDDEVGNVSSGMDMLISSEWDYEIDVKNLLESVNQVKYGMTPEDDYLYSMDRDYEEDYVFSSKDRLEVLNEIGKKCIFNRNQAGSILLWRKISLLVINLNVRKALVQRAKKITGSFSKVRTFVEARSLLRSMDVLNHIRLQEFHRSLKQDMEEAALIMENRLLRDRYLLCVEASAAAAVQVNKLRPSFTLEARIKSEAKMKNKNNLNVLYPDSDFDIKNSNIKNENQKTLELESIAAKKRFIPRTSKNRFLRDRLGPGYLYELRSGVDENSQSDSFFSLVSGMLQSMSSDVQSDRYVQMVYREELAAKGMIEFAEEEQEEVFVFDFSSSNHSIVDYDTMEQQYLSAVGDFAERSEDSYEAVQENVKTLSELVMEEVEKAERDLKKESELETEKKEENAASSSMRIDVDNSIDECGEGFGVENMAISKGSSNSDDDDVSNKDEVFTGDSDGDVNIYNGDYVEYENDGITEDGEHVRDPFWDMSESDRMHYLMSRYQDSERMLIRDEENEYDLGSANSPFFWIQKAYSKLDKTFDGNDEDDESKRDDVWEQHVKRVNANSSSSSKKMTRSMTRDELLLKSVSDKIKTVTALATETMKVRTEGEQTVPLDRVRSYSTKAETVDEYVERKKIKLQAIRKQEELDRKISEEQKGAITTTPKVTPRTPRETSRKRPLSANQRPKTPNQRPKTPNQRPKTPNRRPKTPIQRPKTPNQRPKTPNHLQRSKTLNQRPKTPIQKPKTPNQRPKTPNRRPKTPNQRPKTPNQGSKRTLQKFKKPDVVKKNVHKPTTSLIGTESVDKDIILKDSPHVDKKTVDILSIDHNSNDQVSESHVSKVTADGEDISISKEEEGGSNDIHEIVEEDKKEKEEGSNDIHEIVEEDKKEKENGDENDKDTKPHTFVAPEGHYWRELFKDNFVNTSVELKEEISSPPIVSYFDEIPLEVEEIEPGIEPEIEPEPEIESKRPLLLAPELLSVPQFEEPIPSPPSPPPQVEKIFLDDIIVANDDDEEEGEEQSYDYEEEEEEEEYDDGEVVERSSPESSPIFHKKNIDPSSGRRFKYKVIESPEVKYACKDEKDYLNDEVSSSFNESVFDEYSDPLCFQMEPTADRGQTKGFDGYRYPPTPLHALKLPKKSNLDSRVRSLPDVNVVNVRFKYKTPSSSQREPQDQEENKILHHPTTKPGRFGGPHIQHSTDLSNSIDFCK